jgi:hypothetical protein
MRFPDPFYLSPSRRTSLAELGHFQRVPPIFVFGIVVMSSGQREASSSHVTRSSGNSLGPKDQSGV